MVAIAGAGTGSTTGPRASGIKVTWAIGTITCTITRKKDYCGWEVGLGGCWECGEKEKDEEKLAMTRFEFHGEF